MVNGKVTHNLHAMLTSPTVIADPERRLALSYAPRARRAGLAALTALDEMLGTILRSGREPIVTQMRLTWWYEALSRLDLAPPPSQPILQALASDVLPQGVSGSALAAMIDGWEILLDPDPVEEVALLGYAEARGATLFRAAGQLLGSAGDPLAAAGQGWALVDLACHSREPGLAVQAIAFAVPLLEEALTPRWSKAGRPIGMLARLAQVDCHTGLAMPRQQGSPARLFHMIRHAMTGQ
ncbi:squalene/phytoene synthase family protein [Sphingomonas sp. 28-63-12]|uniref:squalene/phytoene synthase family protein n=1 Tax=Sphingomonas sp. 28-63-12 TaxID=1970434 RepID=UPI0035A9A694